MKKLLGIILLVGLASAVTFVMVSGRLATRHAAERAAQEAAWQADKAELEAALDRARNRKPASTVRVVTTAAEPAEPVKKSPEEIIARLIDVKLAPADQVHTSRQIVYWLEELVALGPDALPAIGDFLARNQDIEYAFTPPDQNRGGSRTRGVPNEFIVPPSLRFGLFDVTRQIGGPAAEKILADILGSTGRGVEVAWLARTLQQMAPDKYREVALGAARDLLSRTPNQPAAGLDRGDREQLFSVLLMYNDAAYVSSAQLQLMGPNGEIDRTTLKYLEGVLGPQAVAIAAQAYDDPRTKDPKLKEPLARLALDYVGLDPNADALYLKAINNMGLSPDQRRNLIEDLNQDGFQNLKNLTQQDVQLIQTRIGMIERLSATATDPVTLKALAEAYKDLQRMLQRANQPKPVVAPRAAS